MTRHWRKARVFVLWSQLCQISKWEGPVILCGLSLFSTMRRLEERWWGDRRTVGYYTVCTI